MRKVLIVSTLSLLAAGCEGTCETLRRVEVWKQQTFFTPNEPVMMAPVAEPTCGARRNFRAAGLRKLPAATRPR